MSFKHTCTTVSLLRRPITNGRISLYLDFYPAIRNPETMKMTRREYLGIYIYAKPRNEMERDFNRQMLEKAEAIRCLRVTSLINDKFDFLDHEKMNGDFLAYFKKICHKKYEKWDVVYAHFYNFVNGSCIFGDLTIELCKNFKEYLMSAHQLRLTHRKISRNSAAGYYSTFRGLLKIAYRDKLIKENINDFLEKIEWEDVKKQYITADELKRLAATPCDIDVLKRASLFSCLTGLRISDILNLKWENLETAPDQGYCIRIRTQKTQTEAILPISYEAIELCGEKSTGKVFKGLTRSMVNYPLKRWIKRHKPKSRCAVTNKQNKDSVKNLSVFVQQQGVECDVASSDSWVILSPIEQSIKRKIEAVGTPLKDWDIQINYGIKTGFNDAFVISTEKRDEILANCQTDEERNKTAELIRPILRGRDIKRYGYEWADKFLIATFPSRHYDIEQYPAVKQHLLSFGKERLEQTGKTYTINGEKIKARKKTNNKWFETQDNISYWDVKITFSAKPIAAPKTMQCSTPCLKVVKS